MKYETIVKMYDGETFTMTAFDANERNEDIKTIKRHRYDITSAYYYSIRKDGTHGAIKTII